MKAFYLQEEKVFYWRKVSLEDNTCKIKYESIYEIKKIIDKSHPDIVIYNMGIFDGHASKPYYQNSFTNREYIKIGKKQILKSYFIDDYPRDYPEPESVVAILRRNMKVEEIPVVMKAREGGVSSISLKKSVYYMIKVPLAILIERIRKY